MSKKYFAHEALSSSGIKKILESPAHFNHWNMAEADKTGSPGLRKGTALHSVLLEDTKDIIVYDETKTLTSVRGKEFCSTYPSKTVLLKKEWHEVCAMARSVMRNPAIGTLLEGCEKELEFYTQYETGYGFIPVKAMLDMRHKNAILDFKSTSVSANRFLWEAKKYRYDIQAAWYQEMNYRMTGKILPFYFIVIESKAPHGVQLYEITQEMMDLAWVDCTDAMDIYAKCRAEGLWPGYDSSAIKPLEWKR